MLQCLPITPPPPKWGLDGLVTTNHQPPPPPPHPPSVPVPQTAVVFVSKGTWLSATAGSTTMETEGRGNKGRERGRRSDMIGCPSVEPLPPPTMLRRVWRPLVVGSQ